MAIRRVVRRYRRPVPEYTSRGCPLTKSHTARCHRVCTPVGGIGFCGRIAPHALLGRTQQAILSHRHRQTAEAEA